MKLATARVRDFKRFTDLTLLDLPSEARLVVLVGSNGTGKSSLFEAFNYWMSQVRQNLHFDPAYHPKLGSSSITDATAMLERIHVTFHGISGDPRSDGNRARKLFYFRSAYRHEPDFTMGALKRVEEILADSKRPPTLMSGETRVSDNYQRMVGVAIETLFDPDQRTKTADAITHELVGRVRDAISRVFPDLHLAGLGRPMQGGTFRFNKGSSTGYHYKNLSGGEKAAFDLLLDFVVKSEAFDDTIFCIEEPELHMHTELQGRLLDELVQQLSAKSQLWISTHSIGMTRRAMALHRASPSEVVFLDFGGREFDGPVEMRPAKVDRQFWKEMFRVALDDLSELVAPSSIVFCEGRKENAAGRRTPTFDASVYRAIFGARHPDTDFVPLGGTTEVENDALLIANVLNQILPSVKTWKLFDRDDRSALEVEDLERRGTRVLRRRDLESYLWDDEILTKLTASAGHAELMADLLAEKQRLLATLPGAGRPVDDIKAITGPLYNETRRRLGLVACGNNAIEFAKATLAPLVTPETAVYRELEEAVFPNG